MSKMEVTREEAAFHEAGHGVAACFMKCAFDALSIMDVGVFGGTMEINPERWARMPAFPADGTGTGCSRGGSGNPVWKGLVRKRVICLLAGMYAECNYLIRTGYTPEDALARSLSE